MGKPDRPAAPAPLTTSDQDRPDRAGAALQADRRDHPRANRLRRVPRRITAADRVRDGGNLGGCPVDSPSCRRPATRGGPYRDRPAARQLRTLSSSISIIFDQLIQHCPGELLNIFAGRLATAVSYRPLTGRVVRDGPHILQERASPGQTIVQKSSRSMAAQQTSLLVGEVEIRRHRVHDFGVGRRAARARYGTQSGPCHGDM
jgi:hypothetical protein